VFISDAKYGQHGACNKPKVTAARGAAHTHGMRTFCSAPNILRPAPQTLRERAYTSEKLGELLGAGDYNALRRIFNLAITLSRLLMQSQG
jgi:hypothetical protein